MIDESLRFTVKIAGKALTLHPRYKAGHVCTPEEARRLNADLAQAAKEHFKNKWNPGVADEQAQSQLDAWERSFRFFEGTGVVDDTEKQIADLARKLILKEIRDAGLAVRSVAAREIARLVQRKIDRHGEELRRMLTGQEEMLNRLGSTIK